MNGFARSGSESSPPILPEVDVNNLSWNGLQKVGERYGQAEVGELF